MKLLFALPGFHRYERGAEVALLNVARCLAADTNVTVVGSGEARGQTPYRYIKVGAIGRETFERFPFIPPFRSETAWEDATFAANLARRVDTSEFDAVITCSFPFTHWSLRKPARPRPLQVFVTQNGDWPAFSQESEYRTFACDLLVCTNPDFQDRNRSKYRTALIPNGVDLDRFGPGRGERDRFDLPTNCPLVLMVSAFIETKRVQDGIRVVAGIPDAHLVVAGDGPLRDAATELADVVMPGRFHRRSLGADDMPALYRSADAFLHMSLLESFGNVFVEAWASGLPIVAHDTARLRWILDDNTDFLCDTQSDEALKESLSSALRHGPAAPGKAVERFGWPSIASDYRTAIASAIDAQ